MAESKKRLMSMIDVKRLVSRWFDERVEIESGAITKTLEAFGDFRDWLKGQRDRQDGVAGYQWGRAMDQKGFKKNKRGSVLVIRGIKLKGD